MTVGDSPAVVELPLGIHRKGKGVTSGIVELLLGMHRDGGRLTGRIVELLLGIHRKGKGVTSGIYNIVYTVESNLCWECIVTVNDWTHVVELSAGNAS